MEVDLWCGKCGRICRRGKEGVKMPEATFASATREWWATRRQCIDCERVFDLTDETDAEEWAYGHDCES
jgi:hypothetical protein